jgi:hypothetical protein
MECGKFHYNPAHSTWNLRDAPYGYLFFPPRWEIWTAVFPRKKLGEAAKLLPTKIVCKPYEMLRRYFT